MKKRFEWSEATTDSAVDWHSSSWAWFRQDWGKYAKAARYTSRLSR